MKILNNRTAERILAKLGKPVENPYLLYYIEGGSLYGQHEGRSRFLPHFSDWEYRPGIRRKLLDMSPEEEELFLRLSQLDDAEDERRREEEERERLRKEAEREEFISSAEAPLGYSINEYGELLDEDGNYMLTIPSRFHALKGEELQRAILSLLEDACYD